MKKTSSWEKNFRGKSVGNHKTRSVKQPRNSSVYAEFENSVSRRSKTRQVIRGAFKEIFRII